MFSASNFESLSKTQIFKRSSQYLTILVNKKMHQKSDNGSCNLCLQRLI